MSSYDPPEEDDRTSSHDPGVQEREITEERQFSDVVTELDRTDWAIIAALLSIPAGLLTAILVLQFIPEYQDTAYAILRWLLDLLP
ncbi:MAG: hypothetical protein V5A56_14945 [Halolamina sp.]